MKYFYKIDNGKLIRGTGFKIPEGFIEYDKDNPPQEFLDLHNQELLEKARQNKKQEIENNFKEVLSQGYVCSNNVKMDTKYEDIQKLKAGYDLAKNAGQTEMIIRDYNNINHILSLNDVNTMLIDLGFNYQAQLAKLWNYKDKIEQATTIEEVEAIKWED